MGANRAMYTGVTNIMDAYDVISKGSPYFSLWFSQKNMAIAFDENDVEAARQLLHDMLVAAENSGNDDLLVIKFHTEVEAKKGITDRSPITGSMYVRVVPVGGNYQQMNGVQTGTPMPVNNARGEQLMTGAQWETMAMLKGLPDTISTLIEAKFASMGGVPAAPVESPFERILGALPEEAINTIATRVMDFIMPAKNDAPVQHMQVAGIQQDSKSEFHDRENEKTLPVDETLNPGAEPHVIEYNADILDNALERLSKYIAIDKDLALLADFAENNNAMFQILVVQLRNQKS